MKEKDIQSFLISLLKDNFHKLTGLLAGIALIVIFIGAIEGAIKNLLPNPNYRLVLYGFIVASYIGYWFYFRLHCPRNKKEKIGLVIAIFSESEKEKLRIKNDFLKKIKKNISQGGYDDLINIVLVPNHISEKLESATDVQCLHKKIKGHFYLWGDVKIRTDGQNKYFLSLNGLVVHRNIDLRFPSERKVKDILARDFIEILPKEVSFFETFEFRGFEFTADIVFLAVKYVVGLAALITGDPFTARNFHVDLKNEFNKFRPLPQHLQRIRDKIPTHLSDEEAIIAKAYFNKKDYVSAKKWLSLSLSSKPDNYGSWLFKAIVDFIVDSNPLEALESIKKAKKYSKNQLEWRYSYAFLKF